MTPTQVLYEIEDALQDSSELPARTTYIVQEVDHDGLEAGAKIPVIQITPVSSARITDFNTDLSGYVTDDNGNQIGRVYHAEYTMTIQIDILTVDNRSQDDEWIGPMSDALRNALYQYDSAGPSRQLAESVWRFTVDEGERIDDLTMNPTLRRWRQDVTLWAYEEFETTEDYIVSVDYPTDDDFNDSDDDGVIENV